VVRKSVIVCGGASRRGERNFSSRKRDARWPTGALLLRSSHRLKGGDRPASARARRGVGGRVSGRVGARKGAIRGSRVGAWFEMWRGSRARVSGGASRSSSRGMRDTHQDVLPREAAVHQRGDVLEHRAPAAVGLLRRTQRVDELVHQRRDGSARAPRCSGGRRRRVRDGPRRGRRIPSILPIRPSAGRILSAHVARARVRVRGGSERSHRTLYLSRRVARRLVPLVGREASRSRAGDLAFRPVAREFARDPESPLQAGRTTVFPRATPSRSLPAGWCAPARLPLSCPLPTGTRRLSRRDRATAAATLTSRAATHVHSAQPAGILAGAIALGFVRISPRKIPSVNVVYASSVTKIYTGGTCMRM
jgi:hypothetical protein